MQTSCRVFLAIRMTVVDEDNRLVPVDLKLSNIRKGLSPGGKHSRYHKGTSECDFPEIFHPPPSIP